MRVFIAFPVTKNVVQELDRVQTEINRLNPLLPVKWVEEWNMHVTVEFLGELKEEQVEEVRKMLKEMAFMYSQFNFCLEKIDAFPSLRRPRVINVALRDCEGGAALLYNELLLRLQSLNVIGNTRAWRPHITLGRIKKDGIHNLQLGKFTLKKEEWVVQKILLIESRLTNSGPIYNVLEEILLK